MAVESPVEDLSSIVNLRSKRGKFFMAGIAILFSTFGDFVISLESSHLMDVNSQISYPVSDTEAMEARSYKSSLDTHILDAAYSKDYGRITLIVEDPKTTKTTVILDQLKTTDEQRKARIAEIEASQKKAIGDLRIHRADLDLAAAGLGTLLCLGAMLAPISKPA